MNFSYEPLIGDPSLGSIIVTSNTSISIAEVFDKQFSWKVGGYLIKDQQFSWNIGDGDYYWYRIEGECREVNCQNFNIDYKKCQSMTFMTVVPGRNLAEVCETLKSPKLNPPVNLRVYSIQKYSRPIAKDKIIEDECNFLQDEFFCQIPECLDYCIDYQATSVSSLDMRAIEASYYIEASGAIHITGRSNNNRYFAFSSDSSLIILSGTSDTRIYLEFYSLEGGLTLGGNCSLKSNYFKYDANGSVSVGGFGKTQTPYSYYLSNGSIYLSGSGLILPITTEDGLVLSGSAEILFSKIFESKGIINFSGQLSRCISPSFTYSGKGGLNASSVFGFNFRSFGVLISQVSFDSKCLDLKSDLAGIQTGPELTITNQIIVPTCGCGPIGLSLLATNNLINSTVFSGFLTRNGKTYDGKIYMKYKKLDDAWHGIQHFYGLGQDGVSFEDWTIFSILTCKKDFWQFSFIVDNSKNQTKIILEIPADLICSDNNISTNISFDINSGQTQSNNSNFVVSSRKSKQTVLPRGLDVYVDGIFNDYLVYYDNLGLFKNSYWINVPFEINLSPRIKKQMPVTNLQTILK